MLIGGTTAAYTLWMYHHVGFNPELPPPYIEAVVPSLYLLGSVLAVWLADRILRIEKATPGVWAAHTLWFVSWCSAMSFYAQSLLTRPWFPVLGTAAVVKASPLWVRHISWSLIRSLDFFEVAL